MFKRGEPPPIVTYPPDPLPLLREGGEREREALPLLDSPGIRERLTESRGSERMFKSGEALLIELPRPLIKRGDNGI
jgi:hypothetical protein